VSGCINTPPNQWFKSSEKLYPTNDYKIPNVCRYLIDLTQTENFTTKNFNVSIIDYSPEQNFFIGNATNNDTAFCFASLKTELCGNITTNLTSVKVGTIYITNALNITSKQENIDFSQTARNFLSVGNCLLVVQRN
jgi:hypothetical protein